MNPAIKIFECKTKILGNLATEICKDDSIPESFKDDIMSLVASINTILEELQPKIQPATIAAQNELIENAIFKNVELDIKFQELLFLIFVYEHRKTLNTQLTVGDSNVG